MAHPLRPTSCSLLPLALAALVAPPARAQAPQALWSKTAHAGAVNAVAFSPDGQLIATAGADHVVKLWRASDGAFQKTLAVYTDEASSVSFSSDGARLASGSVDRTARITIVASGATTCDFTATGFVRDVALSPDSSKLALALGYSSNDFDIVSVPGCMLSQILKPHGGTIWTTAYSANGSWLATAGADGKTIVFQTPNLPMILELTQHQGDVSGVAFSPDGTKVASCGSWDQRVLVWSVPAGNLLLDLPTPGEFLHGIDISPDGRLIAACGEKWPVHGAIHFWRLGGGASVASFAEGIGPNVASIAFAPGNGTFVYGRGDGVLVLAVTPGAFVNVGPGIAGSAGMPMLTGSGDTTAGSATGFTLEVSTVTPSAPGVLFASAEIGAQPLLGGVLYADPIVAQIPAYASASGTFGLHLMIPVGVPPGVHLVLQGWFVDPAAVAGASATNGLAFSVK
jgi:WD40 domain-containing protein